MNDRSDEMKNLPATEDDGFEGYCDTYVVPQEQANSSIIEGTRLKFSNEGKWVDSENADFDTDRELLAVRLLRVVQKWVNNSVVETRILQPHEPWPDLEAMNEACPRSEWREDRPRS